jgi:hypothetical protein
MRGFRIYGPKKPASNGIELANYNILSSFAANTASNPFQGISQGTIRKMGVREWLLIDPSWALGGPDVGIYLSGWQVQDNTNGASASYTFFGTGFDFRYQTQAGFTNSVSVSLNGLALTTANYATATTSSYGNGAFSLSTGILNESGATQPGSGTIVQGLPLALYTVTFTNNTSSYFVFDAIDIITPIHSVKYNNVETFLNSLMVGNCAVSDSRPLLVNNIPNCAHAVASGQLSYGSSTYVAAPISTAMLVTKKRVQVSYCVSSRNNNAAVSVGFALFIDGFRVPSGNNDGGLITMPGANYWLSVGEPDIIPLAPGPHFFQIFFYNNATTELITSGKITVTEF